MRVGQGCRTTGALPCARVHTCTNTPGDRGAAVVGSQLPREGGREAAPKTGNCKVVGEELPGPPTGQ